jgi:prepilin-type N-terminal cleavage/methylation domain-containing protein
MKNFTKSPLKRGFTLIELMVAMAVTTIIVAVLVSITSIALDTWTRSRSEVRAARQAKTMVDSMAHDFEALVTRRGNQFEWLMAKYDPNLATLGTDTMTSSNASQLIFFSAPTDRYEGDVTADTSKGDVSCVSYALKYQDPIQGAGTSANFLRTFVMYRLLVDPDDAFTSLLGKTDLESAFNTFSAQQADVANFLCENVYQYTLTFHVMVTIPASGSTAAQSILVPIVLGDASSNGVNDFSITGSGLVVPSSPSTAVTVDQIKSGRLTALEISLSVITDFGIDQMRNRTFGTEDAKQEFLAKNSYQYSKLVELPTH